MVQVNPTASALYFERIEAMNVQNLEPGKYSRLSSLRDKIGNAYERLSQSDDYKKNENNLKLIQLCVVTVSAVATGYVNAFAHVDVLGWPLALLLALLVTGFVEKFYFTLRHGLTTTYKSGKQRTYAQFWYRVLQVTMVLNATLLFLWIIRLSPPEWLLWYNHYSLAIHFAAALIGVSAVRDSDAVVENRMLELKAETARQDLITAQKSVAIGSPLVLIFAKIRGFFDSVSLAFRLLFRRTGFSKQYVEQIDQIARDQYSYLDAIASPSRPAQVLGTQRRPGFINQGDEGPKEPARWI
jgi:hypothetical protein